MYIYNFYNSRERNYSFLLEIVIYTKEANAKPYFAGGPSKMQLKTDFDVENTNYGIRIKHELWPLGEIDPKKGNFPCCVVWTPLPVVSWLAPFIGHLGICREDGTVIDFSGSNFLNVDDFAFGSVARYLQLEREQVEFS